MTFAARLGLMTLLAFAFQPQAAWAGEDFPFFCAIEDSPTSFTVTTDSRSPTGYTLILYRRLHLDRRIDAEVQPTEDGKYWLIKALDRDMAGLVKRDVLAYIGLFDGRTSHGDVKTSLAATDGRGWDLHPLACRRL